MHEAIATRFDNNLDPLKVDAHRISLADTPRLFFSLPNTLPCNLKKYSLLELSLVAPKSPKGDF